MTASMCPHCGKLFDIQHLSGLIPPHTDHANGDHPRECPGSQQAPRNPESDRRPLWKDLPNGRKPTEHEARSTESVTRPKAARVSVVLLTGKLGELASEPEQADPEEEAWTPLRRSEAVALMGELARLRVFEAAMRSMASQFLCPATSAEEMADQILRSEKEGKTSGPR